MECSTTTSDRRKRSGLKATLNSGYTRWGSINSATAAARRTLHATRRRAPDRSGLTAEGALAHAGRLAVTSGTENVGLKATRHAAAPLSRAAPAAPARRRQTGSGGRTRRTPPAALSPTPRAPPQTPRTPRTARVSQTVLPRCVGREKIWNSPCKLAFVLYAKPAPHQRVPAAPLILGSGEACLRSVHVLMRPRAMPSTRAHNSRGIMHGLADP